MECLILMGYFKELLTAIKAKKQYYRVLIIERGNTLNLLELKEFVDDVIQVDNYLDKNDISNIIEKIMKVHNIKALYATNEWVVEICAYIRDKYKIKGINENVAKSTRDKLLMKTIISNVGIKTAKVEKVHSLEDIKNFIHNNGLPIVLKPQKGSATQNTFIINSISDIDLIISKTDLLGADYIMETFVVGDEYHCDSIVVNGKIIFASIGKYLSNCIKTVLGTEPVASIIFPNQGVEDTILEGIKEINAKVISTLNISSSICHMEVFVDRMGNITFGEIATRIGGGPLIGRTIRHGYGMDIYNEFINVSLDESYDHGWASNKFAGFIALPTEEGRILEISSEEDLYCIDGVKEVCIFKRVGDWLDKNSNTTKRTGYVIVEADSYETVLNRLNNVHSKYKLVVNKRRNALASIY
ncbi:ATP-grasp domain-containing protein [Anaerosporobacter sp.]